jgi:hypothetical protein
MLLMTSTDILDTLHPLTQTQRRAWFEAHRGDSDTLAALVRHAVVTAWESGRCESRDDARAFATGYLASLLGLGVLSDAYALPWPLGPALVIAVSSCRPRAAAEVAS